MKIYLLLLLGSLISLQICLAQNSNLIWGYTDDFNDGTILPNEWYKVSPVCLGERQSPINIIKERTKYDPSLRPITTVKYEFQLSKKFNKPVLERSLNDDDYWLMTNSGAGINYTPINKIYSTRFPPENEEFHMIQFHFHWRPSEHAIDDRRYAAELHLVHRSVRNPTKLAVIGYFMRISEEDNQALIPFVKSMDQLIEVGSSSLTQGVYLNDLVPPTVDRYFRYPGSLTVPVCNETVEWFVVDAPYLTISRYQIQMMASVKATNENQLVTNTRPLQPLKYRTIRRSFSNLNSEYY